MLTRLIPQPLARLVCALFGHRQKVYRAIQDGILVSVSTCRCGAVQDAQMVGANRERRRAARRAARKLG